MSSIPFFKMRLEYLTLFMQSSLLVSWEYYNKIPQTGGLKQQKFVL